jgi:hypothetical protein
MNSIENTSNFNEKSFLDKPVNVLGPRRLFKLFIQSLRKEISNRSYRFLRYSLIDLQKKRSQTPKVSRRAVAHYAEPCEFDVLNEWFDRIVLFTIPRNEETRMVETRKVLSGLKYEVFNGLDQKNHSEEEIRQILRSFLSFPPVNAKHAMMAHSVGFLRFLKEMVEQKTERALFLEDDIALNPYAASIFKQARSELEGDIIKGDWDLIHFHSHLPCTPLDARIVGGSDQLYYPIEPNQVPRDGADWYDWLDATQADPTRLIPFANGRQFIENGAGSYLQCTYRGYFENLSTLCMGVSLNGAKKLLANARDWCPSDRLCGTLSQSKKHKVYIVSPYPCHPRPIASSMEYSI